MATARPARLDGVVKQVVSQPLQVTVTHEGILSKMSGGGKGCERENKYGAEEEEMRKRGI